MAEGHILLYDATAGTARAGTSLWRHELLLLSCDRLLRTLTSARIGLGALATYRQATAVAQTLVASDFNLAADISLNLTAEVTLNLPGSLNCVTERRQLVIIQVVSAQVRRNASLF